MDKLIESATVAYPLLAAMFVAGAAVWYAGSRVLRFCLEVKAGGKLLQEIAKERLPAVEARVTEVGTAVAAIQTDVLVLKVETASLKDEFRALRTEMREQLQQLSIELRTQSDRLDSANTALEKVCTYLVSRDCISPEMSQPEADSPSRERPV